ncbi:response regulator [Burkholderia stagnalis]|uniref:adenylate/guanylate cyclase domain-containing protein n=1 Tax=Burkholderia stagnalis TaxID=1503054 RepID=UPI000F579837|nr:adenylate/guanylate cyclase domain-containing protein [Burkholderia stagnalis]RQQ05782.1 response regulator [Burkholderia stagnalis]RQQ21109.1 response regulator [Burkholderia stagnalis]RQQ22887.1 response regulator [Burkholderia stagnalis]RQQ24569.1 response regulator [Burkholderia stagnalis]RQQ41614.1 response regulator [Burkholderia stagnalis]
MSEPAAILGARILIVDDLEANVLLLEQILRRAGYVNVSSTMDAAEVHALHRAHRYDLILLDLQMPGTDGFQVMESLKALEADNYLPVIVITAQPAHKLRALEAGAKDFISKPFDLAEVLMRVRNMLEVRVLNRTLREQGDELKRLYAKVVAEQKVSERLLLNMLPYPIAQRLKADLDEMPERFPQVIADRFPEVSVLFADIVDFAGFAAGMSAEQLVEMLNDIFTEFDAIADRRGLEKIKTIGDAYMAAAGLPEPVADHAARAAHMALDMIDAMARFNALRGGNLQLRIGINSGEVVAGVIGKRKFIYDLWGKAVNLASRMESQGVAGRVQVTDATRERLGAAFVCEARGTIAAKGIGELNTWFLVGRDGETVG